MEKIEISNNSTTQGITASNNQNIAAVIDDQLCEVEIMDDNGKCCISSNIGDEQCETQNNDDLNAKNISKSEKITIVERIDDDICIVQSCDGINSKNDNIIDDEILEIQDSDDESAKNNAKIDKSSIVVSNDEEICEVQISDVANCTIINDKNITDSVENLNVSEKNSEVMLKNAETETFGNVELNVNNDSHKNNNANIIDEINNINDIENNEENVASSNALNSKITTANTEVSSSEPTATGFNDVTNNDELNISSYNTKTADIASSNALNSKITTANTEVFSSEPTATGNDVTTATDDDLNLSSNNSETAYSDNIVENPFYKFTKLRPLKMIIKKLESKPAEQLTELQRNKLKLAKAQMARLNSAEKSSNELTETTTNSQQLPNRLTQVEARKIRNRAKSLQGFLKSKTLNDQQKLTLEWAERNKNVQEGDIKTPDHVSITKADVRQIMNTPELVRNVLKLNERLKYAQTPDHMKLTKVEARKIRNAAQLLKNVLFKTKPKSLNNQQKLAYEWAERNKNVQKGDIKTSDHMLQDSYMSSCSDLITKNSCEASLTILTKSEARQLRQVAFRITQILKLNNPLELSETRKKYLEWAKRNLSVKQGDLKTENHKIPRNEKDAKNLNEAIDYVKMYTTKSSNELTAQDENLFMCAKEFIMNYDYELSFFGMTCEERQAFQLAKRLIILKQYENFKKTKLVLNPLTQNSKKRASTSSYDVSKSPKTPKITNQKNTQIAQTFPSSLPTFQSFQNQRRAQSLLSQYTGNTLRNSFKMPTNTIFYNELNNSYSTPAQGLRISAAVYTAARYNPTPERAASISAISTISQYTQQHPSSSQRSPMKRQLSYDDIFRASNNNKPKYNMRNIPAGYLIIAILDVGRGDGSTLAANWKNIQNSLSIIYKDVLAANPGPPPICRDVGWFKGIAKLIACADKRSVELYKQAIHKLGEVWPGAKLRVVPQNSITPMPRSRAWIPAVPSTPKDILNLITLSNPTLSTEGWKVAKLSELFNQRRQAVIILNRTCLTQLLATKGVINYGFGSINIRIHRSDLWMAYSLGNTEDLSLTPDDDDDDADTSTTYDDNEEFKDFIDLSYMSDDSSEAVLEMNDNIFYVKAEN